MSKPALPAIRIDSDVILPDKGEWTNRFEIHSESSNFHNGGFFILHSFFRFTGGQSMQV